MRARWLLTLAATLTGCTLLYGPSSDLSNGAAPVDGGAGDALVDGSLAQDAPADAPSGDSSDAAVVFTCPANALLCDDFEHAAVNAGPFGGIHGPVSITTARAHSPTRSYSAITKNGQEQPSLEKQLTLPTTTTLSFWFYAPSVPPKPYNLRIAEVLWGPVCDWELSLTIFMNTTDGLVVSAGSYDAQANPSCGPVADTSRIVMSVTDLYVPKWHHLVVEMNVSAQKRLVTSTIDGVTAPLAEVSSIRTTVPTTALVGVGLPCITTSGGCFGWDGPDYEVLFDDFVLTPGP